MSGVWQDIDLSVVKAETLERALQDHDASSHHDLIWRMSRARSVTISNADGGMRYNLFQQLTEIFSTINKEGKQPVLKRLILEFLVTTTMDRYLGEKDATNIDRFLCFLPTTIETLSLRYTMMDSINVCRLLRHVGPTLRILDLSYSKVKGIILRDIGKFVPNLHTLKLESVICGIHHEDLNQFFAYDCPVKLTHLSLEYMSIAPSQLVRYLIRQQISQGRTLRKLNIRHCDLFTLKDIENLRQITGYTMEIQHNAILTEDSLVGYRLFINMFSQPDDVRFNNIPINIA